MRQRESFLESSHLWCQVVVRAVALLSAKTKWRVANWLEVCFLESNEHPKNDKRKNTNHDAVFRRVQGQVGVACELTYVTIIGTRYPELDNFQNDIIQFGNYLQAEQCTRGGILPIFWDAPYSYIHASTDIGEVVDWITDKFVVANKGDLAVLHNRNKMVNAFTNTEWSNHLAKCHVLRWYDGIPRTTCSNQGVDFLSGGRGKNFHQLPPQEQASQKEEAYARATVALTRAQQIRFIMGPLDMRGLVGAATIIGCLK